MLLLSDIAAQPILQPDEAVALALGLAAALPTDNFPNSTAVPRRPALNQIGLTETGDITLEACAEPIAPGEETQWLAEVIAALLGVEDLDQIGHAIIPGGLLILLARAMGRTSLPALGYREFLDGLERFSTTDAATLKEIHDRCRAQLPESTVETASFADLNDPPAVGPTLVGEDSSPSLLWPQSVAHDDDIAFEREPSLFMALRAPEHRTRKGQLSTLVATAATVGIVVVAAIVWLPQLMAKSPPETAVDALPAGTVWTERPESPVVEAAPRQDAAVPGVRAPQPPSASAEPVRQDAARPDLRASVAAPAPSATANAVPAAPAPPPAATTAAIDARVATRLESVPVNEQLSRSPDGGRLALLRNEPAGNGVSNIWIADTGTGSVTRLTNHTSGRPAGASWFPDGSRIAYGMGDTLVIADVRGGESRRVKSPVPGRPVQVSAVSSDGARVSFQVAGSGTWTYDLHSGEFEPRTPNP
jgi:hypothetical protein